MRVRADDRFEFTTPGGRRVVRVRSEDRRIVNELFRTYCRLRVPPGGHEPDATIDVRVRREGYRVTVGTSRYDICPDDDRVRVRFSSHGREGSGDSVCEDFWRTRTHAVQVPADPPIAHVGGLMEELLLSVLSSSDPDLGCFHAGAVTRDDRCVLIVGEGHAGKTTTSIAACSRGWKLIADDRSFVDLRDGKVIPIQRRPSIRRRRYGSFSLDSFLETDSESGAEPFVRQRYLATRTWRKISDIVVLQGFTERASLRELPASRGLMTVATMSVGLPASVSRRLETLVACFRDVRWWVCELGSPSSSVRCLSERILHA